MEGDRKVIDYLNQALRSELTAINQYMLHSHLLEDWGLERLAKVLFQNSVDEMHHARRLIARILFLEGMPAMQELDKLEIGQDVVQVLENDLKAEKRAIALYREALGHCESVQDYTSRSLFAELLADEEEHHDFAETELNLVKRMGLENYQQRQAQSD